MKLHGRCQRVPGHSYKGKARVWESTREKEPARGTGRGLKQAETNQRIQRRTNRRTEGNNSRVLERQFRTEYARTRTVDFSRAVLFDNLCQRGLAASFSEPIPGALLFASASLDR